MASEPGVGAEQEGQDQSEEDGVEDRGGQAHPTSTTTVAARPTITRKMEGWRSAVVMVSPMPDLSSAWLFEDSFMIQPRVAPLALLPNSVHSLFKLTCVVPSPC